MRADKILHKVLIFGSLFIFLLNLSAYSKIIETKKKDSIYINILYKEAELNDTLFLTLHGTLRHHLGMSTDRTYKAGKQKRSFTFNLPIDADHGYWTLTKARTFTKIENESSLTPMMLPQFWEKGDSITIDLSFQETHISTFPKATYLVRGNGAEKYNASNDLENFKAKNLGRSVKVNGNPVNFTGKEFSQEGFEVISDWDLAKLAYLKNYEGKISTLSYHILKTSIPFSIYKASMFNITAGFYRDSLRNSSDFVKRLFLSKLTVLFDNSDQYEISDEALAYSIDYLNYLFYKYQAESYLYSGKISLSWIYNEVKRRTTGHLRDNLIMRCFLEIRNDTDLSALYQEAEKIIRSPLCIKILEELQIRSAGKQMANFQFQDMDGNKISISDLKNRVVLIDTWFTGCGACTIYFSRVLSKVEQAFARNPNVVFLSISMDQQKNRWLKSVKSGKYTSNEAVNVYTNGLGNRHPFLIKNNIQIAPTAILLDKYGKINLFNAAELYNEKALTQAILKLL